MTSATHSPPKVLWLTSSYPRFNGDSASIFLRLLATRIQQQGFEIHVLAPDHLLAQKQLRDKDIILHHFRYFAPRNRQNLAYGFGVLPNLRANPWLYFQIPFFLVAMTFSSWRLLRKHKPELIHAHWLFPQGTIAVILGKLSKTPVLITTHGGDVFGLQGSLLSRIKRWSIQNCAIWTSNTTATANAVGSDLPKARVIPMGIDFDRFHPDSSITVKINKKSDTFVLLFVGRLAEKKGVSHLINAFSMLPENWKNKTELWIIGDGEKRSVLEKQTVHLGIQSSVKFWGRLANDKLPPYYAAADIFIAPSIIDSSGDTEGQGIVLLEAMASNTAIISSRTGGIEEVINHEKTGLLTNPGKPDQLADAMVRLLENPQLRKKLAQNGVDHARSYEWTMIAKRFADVYKAIRTN